MEIDDQNVNGKKGEAWDEARWGRQQHIFVSVITNYYIYDDAYKPETKVEGWIPSHRAVRVPSPHTTSDDAAMLSKNIYICWCFEEKEKKKALLDFFLRRLHLTIPCNRVSRAETTEG